MRLWNELSPEEWGWLEAHRNLFGLPEDRLRRCLAVMTFLLWPGGERPEIDEIEELMNPFSVVRDPDGAGDAAGEAVSPEQAARMTSMFFAQLGR